MIDQQVEVSIAKPAPTVYDFVITNYVQNHSRFDPHTISTNLNGGAALAVGAAGTEVRRQMGRTTTYEFRVTELTSDHLAFEATGGGTKFAAVWSVVPEGSASRLSIHFRIAMGGLMGLFEPLMKGGVRKDMEGSAQSIKQLVERS